MSVLIAQLALVAAQQAGVQYPESHPAMTFFECEASGCSRADGQVVLDSNWRWTDKAGTNCYTGNQWNKDFCPDPATCAQACALEGAAYETTYGISTEGAGVKLEYVTGGNVGSRVYLMDTESSYKMFYLKNREFSFDVDASQLDCGLNGALYFVEMEKDGGMSKFSGNTAGAKYGTGYCDAQCPHDIKYINGEANTLDWVTTDENSGFGKYGTCCAEMDIWEANKQATAYTAHPCDRSKVKGQTRCEGIECGDIGKGERFEGSCDKDGCDYNAFRLGNEKFFGAGSEFDIDTTQKVTVITQFVTDTGDDTGDLVEIRRKYVQNGKVIRNPSSKAGNSLTDKFCSAEKGMFEEPHNDFVRQGGMKAMGEAMDGGMVLVMSLWDDSAVDMLWLDSTYPTDSDKPGAKRGPCATSSGKPADVRQQQKSAYVTYSNIRFGPFCTTHTDADDNLCKKEEALYI